MRKENNNATLEPDFVLTIRRDNEYICVHANESAITQGEVIRGCLDCVMYLLRRHGIGRDQARAALLMKAEESWDALEGALIEERP